MKSFNMKNTTILILSILFLSAFSVSPGADEILKKVEENMSSENRVFESEMIIHGRRGSRTITSKTYSVCRWMSIILPRGI